LITDVALQFVKQNKGLKKVEKEHYSSPRISSEFIDCSLPLTFDQYNYCSYGCLYCFAYYFKTNNPSLKNHLQLKSVNLDYVCSLLQGKLKEDRYYQHFISKRFVWHWGGLADPFCNFEKTNKDGLKIIELLAKLKYPTLFSLKGDALLQKEFLEIFKQSAPNKNFAFQFSIITADDEVAKYIEIGVPSTTKRLQMMKTLSDMGYYTILRLRPYIIGITNKSIKRLLQQAKEAGANAVSMEFFALDIRSNIGMKERYKHISQLCGFDIERYYKILSPPERGGYRRLNRRVKEPYVKEVYKFCKENGLLFACSDPDFKELNMTGSCCGLPEQYPNNPELTNFSRNQLTYALKELRKRYWSSGGKDKYLSVSDVFFETKYVDWLFDNSLYRDACVCKTSLQTGAVVNTNYKVQFLRDWNNLASPRCPYNYFHGKIKPTNRKDKEGNFIYEYVPHEYEFEWHKEGLL